jgi:pilus assembly protein TadC
MANDDVARMNRAIASLYEVISRCTDTVQETRLVGELLNKVLAETQAGVIGDCRSSAIRPFSRTVY